MEVDEHLKWLPKGWTAVSKTTRSGATLWCFHDPVTGSRFFSKEEVLKHLKTGKICSPTIRETRSNTRRSMEKNCASINSEENKCPVITENVQIIGKNSASTNSDYTSRSLGRNIATTNPEKNNKMDSTINVQDQNMDNPHELPHGWIKESRSRKNGIKSDPIYIDPVSGYEFRSMKDVHRYIETGDIHSCANKPKKRSIGEINALQEGSQVSATKIEWGGTDVKECLFLGESHDSDVKMETQSKEFPMKSPLPPYHASEKSVEEADSTNVLSVNVKHSDGPDGKEIKIVSELNSTAQESKVLGDMLGLHMEQELEPTIENPSSIFSYCLSESQNETVHEPSLVKQLNLDGVYPSNELDKVQHASDLQAAGGNMLEVTNLVPKEEEMELKKRKKTREYGSRKSRATRTITMPLRASPRLAALKAENEVKSALDEESNRAKEKPFHQVKVNSLKQDYSTVSKQELDQQEMSPVDPEFSKKIESKSFLGEVSPAQKLTELEGMSKDKPVSEFTSLFGDSWLDPCIEFAFKTLIGDIPELENTGIVQDHSHQQQTNPAKSQSPINTDSLALRNIGSLNQNEHPAQIEPPNNNMLSFGGNQMTCFMENGLQPTKNLKEVRQWRS
ncbi:hypothetical protein Cni_G08921 [Canna indica]|uniref:MBD domain-containing protein n=1 Tax=Canna indica TaxID=4628 RepID=A0AAQ3Q8V2_9LILI|nr:hypothetical protein Cni_G08921 [Canna indica]